MTFIDFSYVFDNGAAISEVGKLFDDNSVSFFDGRILYNNTDYIFSWIYSANATSLNYTLSMSLGHNFEWVVSC